MPLEGAICLELVDKMLVVAQRNQIEGRFRRLVARQRPEAILASTWSTARSRSGRSGCPGGVR